MYVCYEHYNVLRTGMNMSISHIRIYVAFIHEGQFFLIKKFPKTILSFECVDGPQTKFFVGTAVSFHFFKSYSMSYVNMQTEKFVNHIEILSHIHRSHMSTIIWLNH